MDLNVPTVMYFRIWSDTLMIFQYTNLLSALLTQVRLFSQVSIYLKLFNGSFTFSSPRFQKTNIILLLY